MKKSILVLTACTLITGAMLTGCESSSEKAEDAQEKVDEARNDVTEANKDLEEAKEEYQREIENYRRETEEKTVANDRAIAELRAKIDKQKKEAREEYRKKIDELEQKNTEMKRKMSDYKADGKEGWERFKAEFNRDMEDLGNSFKNLTVDNVK